MNMRYVIALALALSGSPALAGQAPEATNSCLSCHASLGEERLAAPAHTFAARDVHRDRGFGCVDCHGGDPSTRPGADPAGNAATAHDRSRGFRGAPRGAEQTKACARCHSDAELMRRFAPRQRVDQETEYATSVHGRRLATGDQGVATCASCHGAHGIRLVTDARSPVFPTNVAGTCATCHANEAHMRGRTLPGGAPLPTGQLADYQKSVHYTALTAGSDLSAPTCNDCHGNHGVAPPGVGSVANVCGTCHAVFAQKFETSIHAQIFDKGCVECHGNHAVREGSDEMLGDGPQSVCAGCHAGPEDTGANAAVSMRKAIERLKTAIEGSGAVMSRVANAGIEVGPQELALAEARTHLTLARTELHAFDPPTVNAVLDTGLKIVADVDAAGERAIAELGYRRRGLAFSLAAILIFVVALGFKIRQLEGKAR